MEIIQCEKKHIKAVGEFYDAVTLFLEAHVNYPLWIHGEYPSARTVAAAVENASQFFCADGGIIKGAFVLDEIPHGRYENGAWAKNLRRGEYALIHALAVRPGCAGRGVGKRMVGFCIDRCRRAGYKAIRLDVVPGNAPARRLYERMGFTFAGDADLDLGVPELTPLSLYEYNFSFSGG